MPLKEQAENKKKRRISPRKLLLWLVLVFVFFILIWSGANLLFNIFFNSDTPDMLGKITYSVSVPDEDDEYKTSSHKVKASEYVKNKIVYFDFTEIAEKCACKVTGDSERIRYIFEKGDATFFFDSTLAYIGGEPIILESPAIYKNGRLYIPAAAGEYFYGLTVEYSNRKLNIKFDPEQVRPALSVPVERPTPVTTSN